MEIGPLAAQEWPWLVGRSEATGLAQVSPALQAVAGPDAVAARVRQMLARGLSQPGGAVLVARENGAPVGYLVVSVTPDDITGAPVGLFLDIWVEPERRGTGVSSLLTAAGEAHCRGLGLGVLRRAISARNTRSLQHALGDGCRVETYLMEKAL